MTDLSRYVGRSYEILPGPHVGHVVTVTEADPPDSLLRASCSCGETWALDAAALRRAFDPERNREVTEGRREAVMSDVTVRLTREEALALHNHGEGAVLVSAQDKLRAALDAQSVPDVLRVARDALGPAVPFEAGAAVTDIIAVLALAVSDVPMTDVQRRAIAEQIIVYGSDDGKGHRVPALDGYTVQPAGEWSWRDQSHYPDDAVAVQFRYRAEPHSAEEPEHVGLEVTVFAADGSVLDSQDFG